MHTYTIRAISPRNTVRTQLVAPSAKRAEMMFRRSHPRPFEELQITRREKNESKPRRKRL